MAHKDDCPDQAITNKYILRWSENDDIRPKIREDERDAYFANILRKCSTSNFVFYGTKL